MPNLVSEILNYTVTRKILVDDLVVTPRSLKRPSDPGWYPGRMAAFFGLQQNIAGQRGAVDVLPG
jgi:hypothetical protein